MGKGVSALFFQTLENMGNYIVSTVWYSDLELKEKPEIETKISQLVVKILDWYYLGFI